VVPIIFDNVTYIANRDNKKISRTEWNNINFIDKQNYIHEGILIGKPKQDRRFVPTDIFSEHKNKYECFCKFSWMATDSKKRAIDKHKYREDIIIPKNSLKQTTKDFNNQKIHIMKITAMAEAMMKISQLMEMENMAAMFH